MSMLSTAARGLLGGGRNASIGSLFQGVTQAPFIPGQPSKAELDPEARKAQQEALAQLGTVSKYGFTPEDREAIQKQGEEEQRLASAQNRALQNQMANRGMGNSGVSANLQAQAGQSANDRASERSFDIAQLGRQRALQAMSTRGALANDMNSENLRMQQMMDYANQFNQRSLNDYLQNNAAWRNQANASNTGYRRSLFDRGLRQIGFGQQKPGAAESASM